MRIGVFDSGLGGITILNELCKNFPKNEYIYYADLKNLPYGPKTETELKKIGLNILKNLERYNVDQYICACGTLSSVAPSELSQYVTEKNKKIYTIIDPMVDKISKLNKKRILLIATQASIKKGVFENKIKSSIKDCVVYAQACPDFVNLIENHFDNIDLIQKSVYEYIAKYKDMVDVVVCGCTHYILLEKYIKNILGNVEIVEAGRCIVDKMKEDKFNNSNYDNSNVNVKILQSKLNNEFKNNVKKILINCKDEMFLD